MEQFQRIRAQMNSQSSGTTTTTQTPIQQGTRVDNFDPEMYQQPRRRVQRTPFHLINVCLDKISLHALVSTLLPTSICPHLATTC